MVTGTALRISGVILLQPTVAISRMERMGDHLPFGEGSFFIQWGFLGLIRTKVNDRLDPVNGRSVYSRLINYFKIALNPYSLNKTSQRFSPRNLAVSTATSLG